MNILGISAYYHDSAACLIQDGKIIAAAQEERFTRVKQDSGFPLNAVRYCLAEGGVASGEVDSVIFYDKPLTKFSRILKTYFSVAPKGLRSFSMAMPIWMRKKLAIPFEITSALKKAGAGEPGRILFAEHHDSHAASAFYPSPYDKAAIVTLDGVGEWATTSIASGEGHKIRVLEEIHFPHSLGLLYSAFTYFTGFRVNSGEYKMMGLAPYGEPLYADIIRENLIDIRDDGSYRLNMDYFGYDDGLEMTNRKFSDLFGRPAREPESPLTRQDMDLAASIQLITEEIVLKIVAQAHRLTQSENLCLAGGVALNCVANGRIMRESPFKNIWIQPAAGDAGGALGAALLAWHMVEQRERVVETLDQASDQMQGTYLGPAFSDEEIVEWLKHKGYRYEAMSPDKRAQQIAKLIADQKVVGLFQGRMEFGPRALGNRSIIGDARSPAMQSTLNLKIKYRESFRPFAPSCLEERIGDYFEIDRPSPYMLLVAQVKADRCKAPEGDEIDLDEIQRVNRPRSDVPAITHVDYSARIQSVSRKTNPQYWEIIKAFEDLTGYGIIINTSFNVRGEPIVCTPRDAYRCFMRTEMDYLVLGNLLLEKIKQPAWDQSDHWREEFPQD
jgi:carbamoyltransferase